MVQSPGRSKRGCLKQQAGYAADTVERIEARLGAGIEASGRLVLFEHLVRADVVACWLLDAGTAQAMVEKVVLENKDHEQTFVETEKLILQGHRTTAWLSELIAAHNFGGLLKALDVTKAAAEL